MSGKVISSLSVGNEFSRLRQVIIGQGSPYQQDKTQAAAEMSEFPFVPDTDRREEVLALIYPTEEILIGEYSDYIAALESSGLRVPEGLSRAAGVSRRPLPAQPAAPGLLSQPTGPGASADSSAKPRRQP